MVKPLLRRRNGLWECTGYVGTGYGAVPHEAYANWQALVRVYMRRAFT